MNPSYSMSPAADGPADQPYGPPKWSALAISGFVCSLLGFLCFTAVLGVIFGVAGIAVTRSGQRRGLGLAVAALPISLATGTLGLLLIYGYSAAAVMYDAHRHLEAALSAPSEQVASLSDPIYELGSKAFKEDVTRQALGEWLKNVVSKHGNLAQLSTEADRPPLESGPKGLVAIYRGKFTNGTVMVRVFYAHESFLVWRVADIEVDGQSVRPAAGE